MTLSYNGAIPLHIKYNSSWVNTIIYNDSNTAWAPTHSANYWNYDANNHWKTCTVCGIMYDKGAHVAETVYENGHSITRCSICHYNMTTS